MICGVDWFIIEATWGSDLSMEGLVMWVTTHHHTQLSQLLVFLSRLILVVYTINKIVFVEFEKTITALLYQVI